MANFDSMWDQEKIAYGAASGAMDNWVVNPISGVAELQDTTEVGIYRTMVNMGDTQASTWELLYGADDFIAEANTPADDCIRYLDLSDITIGPDGTIYVPFSLFLDDSMGTITPWSVMRFTLGGMVRCLDGTQTPTEWTIVPKVLGPFDGLYRMCVAPGSNHLFSAAYDVWDWRFKLATYEDTFSGAGPSPGEPANGAIAGTLVGDAVSVPVSWADIGADTYELQAAKDSAFTSPISVTTSDTAATIPGLDPGVTYYWRVRALSPIPGGWSQTQDFITTGSSIPEAPELLSPAAGAEGVTSKPAFSWSSISWAEKYQIMVAVEPFLVGTPTVVNEVVEGATAYQPTEDLDDGTYYWRVQAQSDTRDSEWSDTGVFTIGGAPGEGTPAWVWVVIVIGALLLIAVLVLIVRTRRAV
jgi:hypothetical protein